MKRTLLPLFAVLLAASVQAAEPTYVKKTTRVESIVASLQAAGLPTLEGDWHYVGPFDNLGIDAAGPPEKEIDLTKTCTGKDGQTVAWAKFKTFPLGSIVNLKLFKQSDNCVVYLYHEITVDQAVTLPVSLGSDDFIKVWLNGEVVGADDAARPAAPDQDQATLKLKPGKNQLLIKVGNIAGDWAVYVAPELPPSWPAKVRDQLAKDFPTPAAVGNPAANSAENAYYRMVTLPVPKDCVMEVGGLAMRPDGKLLACTRRGEVWLIDHPESEDPDKMKFKLFANGLHEALGLCVDGKDVYVVQRPELTKLVDTDGDDVADEYQTVCDKWGVSGDYHEFAFGPARDKDGNFFVTLNVGFGGGHQSKAPWRGWCVKITPKGELQPWATGLRSPNGINFSPDGDLFYVDNQGEWVPHLCDVRDSGRRILRPSSRAALGQAVAVRRHAQGRRRQRDAVRRPGGQERRLGDAGADAAGRLVPLRPHGSVGQRTALGHDGRQVRAVRRPVFRRRSDEIHRYARLFGEDRRPLPGGLLPVPQRLRVRRQPAGVRAGRQPVRRHD